MSEHRTQALLIAGGEVVGVLGASGGRTWFSNPRMDAELVEHVPCDDMAVERAVAAMCAEHGAACPQAARSRETVLRVLRAAGEVPS